MSNPWPDIGIAKRHNTTHKTMGFIISSYDGTGNSEAVISTASIINENGTAIYTYNGIEDHNDFCAIVSHVRRNLGDLSYKDGYMLIELLGYRLASGTSDLTQDLRNGCRITFG